MPRQQARRIETASDARIRHRGHRVVAGKVVGQRALQCSAQLQRVARGHQPGLVVTRQHLGNTEHIGADNADPQRHGLQQHARKRFLETGADEEVGHAEVLVDVTGLRDDPDPGQAEQRDILLHGFQVEAVAGADDEELGLRATGKRRRVFRAEPVGGAEEDMLALALADGADVDDERDIGRDAVPVAQFLAAHRLHLTAEIGHRDLETRVAILKRKAEIENMALSDEVALSVATVIRSNVRELEGALLQMSARASITGRSIDKEFAEEVLKDLVSSIPQGFSIESIQREVATYFDIKLHDLRGPKRLHSVARPRMIAMYLARKLTGSSFPEIGSRFGGKDHSTVISAVKKIEGLIAQDANLRSVVTTLESHLRQR